MNDTIPPADGSDSHPSSGPGHTPPPGGNNFFSWLRRLGITRRTDDRWFAGVASGIASRAGIDPLIVRGIFVVLAFLGGPGVLLYLAGWLLLPDQSGRIHVEEIVRGRAKPGVIVAAVILAAVFVLPVLIGVLSTVFGGPGAWGVWEMFWVPDWVQVTLTVLWWAVLLPAGIIWLIVWISRGGLGKASSAGTRANASASPPPSGAQPAAESATAQSHTAGEQTAPRAQQAGEKTGAWGQQAGEEASAWAQKAGEDAASWGQKIGAEASAWGQKVGQDTTAWAEAERLRYESRKLGAGQILVTFALALLAAGGVAAWALSTGAEGRFVYTTSIVAAVAVCALSMIVAGVRGRHSGWIGFAALAGSIALVFTPYTSIMPDDLQVRPLGDSVLEVSASTPSESGVAVLAGDTTLDLTALDARDSGRTVEVWMLAGNVDIELPKDHPTRVTVQLIAGNTTETSTDDETRTTRGPFQVRTTGANLTDAEPNDITEVHVRMLAGNVDIDGTDSRETRTLESEATQ